MADVQLESREGDQHASRIFLFQRFPKQVKGGFLIEGGNLEACIEGGFATKENRIEENIGRDMFNYCV